MADDTMLEEQIGQWRGYLQRRRALAAADIAELEDHLREQVADLRGRGLWPEEAFLVAVRRMGALDALSQEFAHEHSERLWKQLVAAPSGAAGLIEKGTVAILLAVAAALLVKLPLLLGWSMKTNDGVAHYLRNASFFALPLLTVYFARGSRLSATMKLSLAALFALACVLANLYSFAPKSATQLLTILHLPLALWLVAGVAYAGVRWNQTPGRMDFIRFSGEFFIYYVLIGLGGGVFMGFTAMIFRAASLNPNDLLAEWVAPCGAAGAVLIAAWLVEAKQSVIENMAPVLARLFTPLFTALLLLFLATLLITHRGLSIERELLIGFDLLLALAAFAALLVDRLQTGRHRVECSCDRPEVGRAVLGDLRRVVA